MDDYGRQIMLFFARTLPRSRRLVPPSTPLVMTARVF
jgi:hypothetical protein